MTNPEAQLTGVVDFPEAGDNVYLKLTTADFLQVQARFGEDWMQKVNHGFDKFDFDVLTAIAELGGKRGGKSQKINIGGIENLTLIDLRDKLRDAYFYAYCGRSFMEQVEFAFKAQADAAAKGEPDDEDDDGSPRNPEASSER
ncbi:hypothetical protein [Pleomorphomonas sp. PLEO]|uniref:hypothetical protein n=1 Tax=Pleomorphomonas sp. PLEO TaxID=3239306 RepID=UPI00351F4173